MSLDATVTLAEIGDCLIRLSASFRLDVGGKLDRYNVKQHASQSIVESRDQSISPIRLFDHIVQQ